MEIKRRAARAARAFSNLSAGGKLLAAAVGLFLLFLLYSLGGALLDSLSARRADRRDERSEASVRENLKEADAHADRADDASVDRRVSEAAAREAQEVRQRATQNSARTEARARQAKERYEETRNTGLGDIAPIPDDRICAELERRGIPCQ